MNKNIEPVIEIIRNINKTSLQNEAVVENLIRSFGLVFDGAKFYGYDNKFMVDRREETGIYQTPRQFAQYLIWLSTKKITSYLEIGIFKGGSYVFACEYLKRFGLKTCKALDITDQYLNEDIKPYLEGFEVGDSREVSAGDYDLVMIDGDHQYESAVEDYLNVGKFAKFCAIHDIVEPSCPGVIQFWNELKAIHTTNCVEFNFHSEGKNSQGIGVIKLK